MMCCFMFSTTGDGVVENPRSVVLPGIFAAPDGLFDARSGLFAPFPPVDKCRCLRAS